MAYLFCADRTNREDISGTIATELMQALERTDNWRTGRYGVDVVHS